MTEDVDGSGFEPGPERGKWAAPRQRQGARGKLSTRLLTRTGNRER